MNYFRSALLAASIAAFTFACNDSTEEAVPYVDFEKQYTAKTISTGGIFIGTRQGWITDATKVNRLLNRLNTAGSNPGFKEANKTLPLSVPQTLSFEDDMAHLTAGAMAKHYEYEVLEGRVLALEGTDPVTYFIDARPEAVLKEMGFYAAATYNRTAADESTGYDYQVNAVHNQYASIGVGQLQFPRIVYYLKTNDGSVAMGTMNNYLREDILKQLVAGDTLLIQLIGENFE